VFLFYFQITKYWVKTLFGLGSAVSYTTTYAGAPNTRPSVGAERT
jgi:hypothetical protein